MRAGPVRGLLAVWVVLGCLQQAGADSYVGPRTPVPQALAGSPPGIASDGHQYLVVWVTQAEPRALLATRVLPDGTVRDAASILLDSGSWYIVERTTPAVAFDGQRFVVAWNTALGIRLATVERDGTASDQGLVGRYFDSWHGGLRSSPALACSEGTCLLAWARWDRYVAGQWFRADSTHPASEVFIFTSDGVAPSVSESGGRFLVTWTRATEDGTELRARLVPALVPVQREDGFVLRGAEGNPGAPHVGSAPDGWLVTWEERRSGGSRLYGTRVDLGGVPSHEGGVPLVTDAGEVRSPHAAFDGARWFVTWEDASARRIRGARVEANLSGPAPSVVDVVDERFDRHRAPAVALAEGTVLVTWAAGRGQSDEREAILGARLGLQGAPLEAPALVLSRAAGTQQTPAAAYGAGAALVVWAETRGLEQTLFAARLGPDNKRMGAELALPAAPGSRHPAVAFDGSRFLVVWEEPALDGSTDIRGARVSATGKLLDTASLPVSTAPGAQRTPAVAFAAGRFWVVWEDTREGSAGGADVYGARVRYTGTCEDPGGLRLSPLEGAQRTPQVSSVGENVLVVWEEARPGEKSVIRGTRVRWNGTVLDASGLLFSDPGIDARAPALASGGEQAFVVWEADVWPRRNIFGTLVDAAGQVQRPGGVVLTFYNYRKQRAAPAVAFLGGGFGVYFEEHAPYSSIKPYTPDIFFCWVPLDGPPHAPNVGTIVRNAGVYRPVVTAGPDHQWLLYTQFIGGAGGNTVRIRSW